MRTVFITIILFSLVSCMTSSNWTKFSGNGLPDQNETYKDIHFINEKTGYIGGSHLTLLGKNNNTTNFKNTAVLYKTLNQGKDWQQIALHFLGSVEKILSFGDTLILQIKSDNDSTLIVRSDNNGKDWGSLLTLTNHSRIINMDFSNSIKGQFLTTDRQNVYLIAYSNNRFDTLVKFQGGSQWDILGDNVISLNNVPSTADYNGYTLTDIKTGSIKEFQFDKSYFIASHYKYEDNLYLAASKNNIGYILKLNAKGFEKIELGKYSKYEPNEVFAYGVKLIAIGNRQDEVGPIGVIHSFFISTDGGKTWDKENLPSPMCIEAPAFFKDKFFISAACPPGYFQLRR